MSVQILPQGWMQAKLEEITTIVGGGTPSRDNPENFQGNIPWVTSTDITKLDDIWINETAESISDIALRNSSAVLLPVGSVLMTCRASFGHIAINRREMCTSQSLYSFICNDTIIYNEYLAYYLTFIKERLGQLAGETTFKGISKTTLEKVEIITPTLPEQRRIVAILRQADHVRRLRREAEEKQDKLVATLFYAIFGDLLNNKNHWQASKIENICELVRGSSPRPQGDPRYYGGEFPRLMVSDMTRDSIYVTPMIDSLTEDGAMLSRFMKQGSVVMAVSGQPGVPAILQTDAYIHDGFVGFRNLSKDILPEYLFGCLWFLKEMHQAQAIGATFQNLTTDQIKNWEIVLPPLFHQILFVKALAQIWQLYQQTRSIKINIDNFYHNLLSRAFTGDLTANWREQHQAELQEAIREREAYQQQRAVQTEQKEHPRVSAWQAVQKTRSAVLKQLSTQQHMLLQELLEKFEGYFQAETIATKTSFAQVVIRQGLQLFTAMGFIQRVRVPVRTTKGTIVYLQAYRTLIEQDHVRERELQQFQKEIEQREQGFDFVADSSLSTVD